MKTGYRLLTAVIIAVALCTLAAACGSGSNSPTSQQLTSFVTGAQTSDGAIIASLQTGTPPAANGGPAVTVSLAGTSSTTGSATVVAGATNSVNLRTSSPFSTVYVQVVDDPLSGYYQLLLSNPTTNITIVLKLGGSIPVNAFQTVFSVALGNSVGPSTSIADSLKTLTSVGVSGTAPAVGGAAQQFAATANFSDGSSQAVTNDATWTSSATGVATVTSTGLVSAVATGTATISAAYGGATGQSNITVTGGSGGGGGTTPTTFTVSGTVTDGTDNFHLPNINVTLGSRSTTTDANGNYAFTGVSAGSVTVVASAASYISSSQTVTVTGNTTVNFTLSRVSASITSPASGATCTAPPTSAILCTFVGSTNIPSPSYSWTFVSSVNDPGSGRPDSAAATGQTAAPLPTLSCGWSGDNSIPFTITVTLTVTGGGLNATSNETINIPGRGFCAG